MLCRSCGYEVPPAKSAAETPRCPECGTDHVEDAAFEAAFNKLAMHETRVYVSIVGGAMTLGSVLLLANFLTELGWWLTILATITGWVAPLIYLNLAFRHAAHLHGFVQARVEGACLWLVIGFAQTILLAILAFMKG